MTSLEEKLVLLEKRVEVLEKLVKELKYYNDRNIPAIQSAWMHVPIGRTL